MKKEEFNREKIIHRWNPAIILMGLGSLASLILSSLILFLPLMSVNYNDGGVISNISVNGLDIINGAASSFGISLLGDGNNLHEFLKVFDQDFSGCANPILVMFHDFFPYAILALAVFTLLPIIVSIPQVFLLVRYIIFGTGKKFKAAKRLAKSQTYLLGVMAFIYLIFYLLFNDVVKLMCEGSSVDRLQNTWVLLLIGIGISLFLEILYSFFLKGRIMGSRTKVYAKYKSSKKNSKKDKKLSKESKSNPETKEVEEIKENNEEEIVEELVVSDEEDEENTQMNSIPKVENSSINQLNDHNSEA